MIRKTIKSESKKNRKETSLNRSLHSLLEARRARNSRRRFESRNILRRKRMFEGFASQDSFESSLKELQDIARQIRDEYGEEVTDEMNVVFWAKDDDGTPCLVKGAYNYWSGDAELTMTELADGASPDGFIKDLDEYIAKAPEFIAEYLAEYVAESVIEEFNLDADRWELQEIMWKQGDTGVDYNALYNAIKDELDGMDEDEFVEHCQEDFEPDHDRSGVDYGWEYSTVNQGNLFYGRSNHVDGPTFGEEIYLWDSIDMNDEFGIDIELNEDGLWDLAEKIANNETESPRY